MIKNEQCTSNRVSLKKKGILLIHCYYLCKQFLKLGEVLNEKQLQDIIISYELDYISVEHIKSCRLNVDTISITDTNDKHDISFGVERIKYAKEQFDKIINHINKEL